jgi:hypothetical protein
VQPLQLQESTLGAAEYFEDEPLPTKVIGEEERKLL